MERRVDRFRDKQVGLAGDDFLEVVARLTGPKRRAFLARVMANDDDRLIGRPPRLDQRSDVPLAARIVARAPELSVVKALLDVDDDQRIRRHAATALHLERGRPARPGARASTSSG